MEDEIIIKPYEPVDDEGLKNLVIENMFHTQRLTRSALITWTIKGLGYFKTIAALSLTHVVMTLLFVALGFEITPAATCSFGLMALILTVAYGIELPIKFANVGRHYAVTTVSKDFEDI